MDDKINCSVCGELDCYKESENDIDSYLCMNCGYTTTSLNKEDSIELRNCKKPRNLQWLLHSTRNQAL